MKLRYLYSVSGGFALGIVGGLYAHNPEIVHRAAEAGIADWRTWDRDAQVGLVAIIVGVITSVLLHVHQLRKTARASIVLTVPEFPFEVYSSNDLGKLGFRLLAHHSNIPYVSRLTADRQTKLESCFDSRYLLVTGRSGLGKTRECIEAILRLARKKGEDFTVLYALDHLDVPDVRSIPSGLSNNVILFVNDAHQKYVAGRDVHGREHQRSFHDRLFDTVQWFNERFKGGDFRVLITARDEPDLGKRLKLESEVWAPFKRYPLPNIHKAARRTFVETTAAFFKLTISEEAITHIIRKCDGTTASIITVLTLESARHGGAPATVELSDLQSYQFTYPQNWDEQVYKQFIAPHRFREAVFWALAVLYQLRLPSYGYLAVELASRRWSLPIRAAVRWRLYRTIRKDLASWMFIHADQVICPAAYLEDKADLAAALPAAESVLLRAFRHPAKLDALLPAFPALPYTAGERLGQWGFVVRILSAAAELRQDAGVIWAGLAMGLNRLGRHREATEAAKRAKAIAPDQARSYILLANAYTQAGRHTQALRELRQATQVSPGDYDAWLCLGVVLSKAREDAEAIAALEAACNLNPRSAKAHYSLGIAYERTDPARAIEECRRAAELDPYDPIVWRSLGISHSKAGDPVESLRCLEKARDLEPDSAATLISLARAYAANARIEEAITLLRKVAEQPDKRSVALNVLAVVLSADQRLAEAESVAGDLVRSVPMYADAWATLAHIRSRRGDLAGTIEAQRKLTELRGSAPDWNHLAGSLVLNREYAEAARIARMGLRAHPDHPDLLHALARALAKQGDHGGALEVGHKVAQQRGSPWDWYRLSVALGTMKQHHPAVVAAARALEIDPVSDEMWERLSDNAVLEAPPTPEAVQKLSKKDAFAADCWSSLARNLGPLGRFAQSAAAWRQVVRLRRRYDDWRRLSTALTRSGQHQQALLAAMTATEIDPTLVEGWDSLTACARKAANPAYMLRANLKLAELRGNATDWYNLSVGYGQSKRHEEGVEAARKAIALDAHNAAAWYSLALNYGAMGRPADSLAAQEKALELRGSAEDWYRVSVVLGKAGRYGRALQSALKAVELAPGMPDAWHSVAVNRAYLKQLDAALEAQQEVVRLRGSAVDWYHLSMTFNGAARYAEGAKAAASALNLDLGSGDALRSLIANLHHLPEHSPAAIQAINSIAAQATQPLDWVGLSEALSVAEGDPNAALSAIDEALRRDESNPALLRIRSAHLVALGREQEARQARDHSEGLAVAREAGLRELLCAHPNSGVHWRQLARLAHQSGRIKEMVEFAVERLVREPSISGAVMEVANELLNEVPEQIVPLVERVLAVAPNSAEYWQILGVCLRKMGNTDRALAAIKQAIDRDSGVAAFWYALGRVYEDIPDERSARQAYRKAVELQPGYRKAHERLTALGTHTDDH